MPLTFRSNDTNSNTYARFPVEIKNQLTNFVTADSTNLKTIATSTTTHLGSRIAKILVSSDDTASNIMRFHLFDSTTASTLPFGFIAIPNASGTGEDTAKGAVSVLRSTDFDPIVDLDNNGNPYLLLEAGWSLQASLILAPSADKTIQVACWIDNY